MQGKGVIVTNKDQDQFKAACLSILGRAEYQAVIGDATDAYHRTLSAESNQLKKRNAATRAANLVLLAALKEAGVTNWRHEMSERKKSGFDRIEAARTNPSPLPPTRQPKKAWQGKSIVEMGDENLKRMREKR